MRRSATGGRLPACMARLVHSPLYYCHTFWDRDAGTSTTTRQGTKQGAKWVEKHKGKAQVVEGGDPIRLTGLHVPLGVFNEHRKSSTGPEPKDFLVRDSTPPSPNPTYRALACPTPLQSEQASRDPAKEDTPVGRALPSAQRTL